LAICLEEADRILEVIGIHGAAEGLDRLERHTVAGVDVSHFSFGDADQRFLMNAVLPRIESEVNSATQESSLEAGLAIAGNDLAFAQRTFAAPDFLDNPDLGMRDINNPEQPRQAEQGEEACEPPNPGFNNWK
jgi:hypothetical protein